MNMKMIVNCKYFAGKIKEALENQSEFIEIDADAREIRFTGPEPKPVTMESVTMMEAYNQTIPLKRILLYRLMKFLKMLPEQPTTVYIEDETITVYSEMQFKDILKIECPVVTMGRN